MRGPKLAFFLTLLGGCGRSDPLIQPEQTTRPPPDEASNAAERGHIPFDPRFTDVLLSIGKEYERWGLVNPRWALGPQDCSDPHALAARTALPLSRSAATDGGHARKLYQLYARDRSAYLALSKVAPGDQPAESRRAPGPLQAVVKQAWRPDEVDAGSTALHGEAFEDGKLYTATEKVALFVMMQTDPSTPGTDHGWLYATLTPDGATITASGVITSCQRCHVKIGERRLFGGKRPASGDAGAP